MVSFLHQLNVLLWKNWLSVRRQPVWSCVLIIWPIVIFIILAITRSKFPPEPVQNCYLAPRNLPSTGLVPFLETYLCATDSRCKNSSYVSSTSGACDASNNGLSNRMLDLPWNSLHVNRPDTQTDDGGGSDPSLAPPEPEVDKEVLPGSSSSRAKRDTGGGIVSGATLILGQISDQTTFTEILKILLCNLTRNMVPATSNNTGIQFVANVLSNYCSTDQSLLSASIQEVRVSLLPLLADPQNQVLLLSGVYKGLAIVKTVQGSTGLWNSLLDLPQLIFDLQSPLTQNTARLSREARSNSIFQDVQYITSCLNYFKKLGQVGNSSDQTQTTASTSIIEDLGGCMSLYQKFTCDPSIEECWPEMQHYYERVYWLITSLTNISGSSACSFDISSMDVVCEDSTTWQQFYQSALIAIQTAMQNHTAVQRILNQGWTLFQQNGLGEILSLALNSQPTNQSSWNQELPPIVKDLLGLLLNASQEMLSMSFQTSHLNYSSISMELVQTLLKTIQQTVLQNIEKADGNNLPDLLKTRFKTVQSTQLWQDFSLGSNLPLNETSQIMHNLQTLIKGWMSLSSRAGDGSFNYTTVPIQIFSILNKPEFTQLLQSVQNFLMANQTSTHNLNVFLDSLKLFTQMLSMKGTDDVHVLKDAYLKQVLNVLLSGSSLQGALSLLTPYFNMSSQLPSFYSNGFSTITLEILSFLNPRSLQNAGISGGNISSTLFSLFSDFIPKEYQETFQGVVNATLHVLELIEVCKDGPSNCIQSQLLAEMGTLTNLLPMLLSSNITEFLQPANKVLIVTSCYNGTHLDPLVCTLDLTLSLVELLQTLQHPQPVLDRILIVGSIVQYWKSEIGGKGSVDQQLSYLHDVTTIIFQNEPTLLEICSSISDIVHALNATSSSNTSNGLSQTVNVLFSMMQFSDSAALRHNISSDFFFKINGTLKNAKTQLQIAAAYLIHLTNQTEVLNLSNVIYHMYKMTLLIAGNSIANSWNYTEDLSSTLSGLSRQPDLLSILRFLSQDHVHQLQLFINATQTALGILFPSYEGLWLPWLALNTEDVPRVLQLALTLLQEYGVNQSETNVVLQSIENTIQVLKYLREHLAALGVDSKAFHTGFDNETAHVVYALFTEGTSILHEIEEAAASKEIFQRLYHFTHLLVKNDRNGTVLQNVLSFETQLLNILFAAISPFLGENSTSEASPRTCSVKDALHIISRVIFQNETLSESIALTDCQMPFTVMTFENGTMLNQTLGETLQLIMQIIGLSNEYGTNFETGQANAVGEFMACIIKSLRLSIGVLLDMSDLSGIKGPWIQHMYETLTSISEAVPESNISCITPNSQILSLVDNICLNHSNPLHVVIAFIYNQTYILKHGSSSNRTDWSKMYNMITKLLDFMHGHPNWNNTIYELLLQWSNSSELLEFRTVWNIVNIILRTNWNLTEIDALVNNLETLKSAVDPAGNKVGPEAVQVYEFFASILHEKHTLGLLDLINMQNVTLSSAVLAQCKLFSEFLDGIFFEAFNQTQAWTHNGLLSNIGLWTCSLVSNNNSFSMLEEGLKIFGTILSSTSLGPRNILKHLNVTEKLFSVFQEAILNGPGFSDVNTMQALSELFIPLIDEIKTPGQLGTNPALRDLFSLLIHIIQNDTSSNTSGIIDVEKATFQAASILRELLKTINATSAVEDIYTASDMLQLFFYSIHNSPDEKRVAGRILEQTWAIFQRSGIEKLLSENIQLMLSKEYPDKQQLPAVATSLLQILFNITNELLSDMTIDPPFLNSSTLMDILNGLLEKLQQIAHQDPRLKNWRKIFQVFVQDVEIWNKLSIGALFMQNETDQVLKELETLIASWTTISNSSFSTSKTIMKLFYVLNQPEFMQLEETFHKIFSPGHNFTQVAAYLLDALQIFNHMISMNSTVEVQVPTEVYLKQILNYLTSDTNIQRVLFLLGTYINISRQLPFVHSEELRDVAVEILSFISPPILLNLSTFATNTPAALLSLISKSIPRDEKAVFDSAANITLLAIESMQMCHTEQSNCTRTLHEFQQVAGDFVQLLTKMENSSLGEQFNISSVPYLAVYEDIQVSLINSIFSFLWSSINSESDITVFQKVISLRDAILNVTLKGDLNWTLVQSLSGPSNINGSEVRSMLEMFASSNISELLFHIQSVLHISDCNNRPESFSLLCTLDLTLHVMDLLQRQSLPQPLQGRLSIVISIIKFWIGALKENVALYQQLNHLYDLTIMVFQNEPVLNLIHSTVSDIVQSLNDIRIKVNVSSTENEATITTLLDLIQPQEFGILEYNMSDTFYFLTKNQLQKMQVEFQIAKWYIFYLKNRTEGGGGTNVGYPWYSISQLILSNTLPNIQNYSPLQSILNNMQSMAAFLNQSQNISAIQKMLTIPFQDVFQELKQFINYTEAVIHMLIPNHTNPSVTWEALLIEDAFSVVESALHLLHENNRNKFMNSNMSLAFDFPYKILEMLNDIRRMFLVIDAHNLGLPTDLSQESTQKLYEVLKGGVNLINSIKMGGTSSKEIVYAMYNFSHLLLGEDFNGTFSHNASMLDSHLLDSLISVLTLALTERNENGSTPQICSATDVIHLMVGIAFGNNTLHESLSQTGCQLSFVFQHLENGKMANQTLEEILQGALKILKMAVEFAETYNLNIREQTACIINSLQLSTYFFSKLDNIAGYKTPWIQPLHKTLSTISEQLTESNITCAATLSTPIINILDNLSQNQFNPFHFTISLILSHIDLYAHGTLSNISLPDLMLIFTLLPNFESWTEPVFELIQVFLNPPRSPEFDLLTRAQHILERMSAGNWTKIEVSEVKDLLERLTDAFNLTSSGLGPDVVQAHQFLTDILKGLNAPSLLNLSSWTALLDSTAVSHCKDLVKILVSASENILKDLEMIPPDWADIGLASNVTSMVCDLLLSNNTDYDWVEEVKKVEAIISYMTPFAPAGTDKYFQAAGKFLPLLSGLLLNGTSFTPDYGMGSIFEMLTLFLELFDQTKVVADVLATPSLQDLFSLVLNMATAGGNGSRILAAEEGVIAAINFVEDTLRAFNFSSSADTLTHLSEILQLLLNSTEPTAAQGSTAGLVLHEMWIISQRSGFGPFLYTKLNQLISSQSPGEPHLSNLMTTLLQMLQNVTGTTLSTASPSPPYLNINTSINIIQSLLDHLQQMLLQEAWPSNGRSITQALIHVLQVVLKRALLWQDSSIYSVFSQNDTNQSLQVLEMLIKDWISWDPEARDIAFNYSTAVIKIFSILNQAEVAQLTQILRNVLSTNSGSDDIVSTLLDCLDLFIQINRENGSVYFHAPVEVYLKQVVNFLASDKHLQGVLLMLRPYFNISSQLPFVNLDELRDVALQVLPFIDPFNIEKVGGASSNIPSILLSLFSKYILEDEQEVFHFVANSTLQFLESMQMCNSEPSTCISAINEFQQLLFDIVQFITVVQNDSLGENFDNSSLLHFEIHNQVQISLINTLYIMMSYSSDNFSHAELATGVYERVVSMRNLILNRTAGGDINATIAGPLLGTNGSEVDRILEVFTSINITESLFQILGVLNANECNNQTEPLLCILNITCNLMGFIQRQRLPRALHDRLTIVTSIITFWLRETKGTTSLDKQISYFYNLTILAVQNNSILHLISSLVTDVIHTLEEMQIELNTSSSEANILMILLEMVQLNGSINLSYSVSELFHLPVVDQLENVKVRIQIAQWFIIFGKNLTEGLGASEGAYPMYRIIQLILSELIANMKDDSSFSPIVTYIHRLVDAFNQSHNPTQLLNTLKMVFQDGTQLVQLLINHTQAALEILFPNQTPTLLSLPALLNADFPNAMRMSLSIFQEYLGETASRTNISIIFDYIDRTLWLLHYFQETFTVTNLEHPHLLINATIDTVQKAFEILQKTISLLHASDRQGITEDIIHKIYNFTHLIFMNDLNLTSVHASSLETKILNLLFSAISPFLVEININQDNPRPCSVKDVLHVLSQMTSHNLTLNESLAEIDCQMPFSGIDFGNDSRLNQTFGDIVHLMGQILGLANEFATEFGNMEADVIVEPLVCMIKTLHRSTGLLSQVNSLSVFQVPWVQPLYDTLTSLSEMLSTANKTCGATDTPIFDIIDSILNNQTTPLDILTTHFFNQIEQYVQGAPSNTTAWEEISKSISLFNSLKMYSKWTSTIDNLMQVAMNSSNISILHRLPTFWPVIYNLLNINQSNIELNESIKILETIKTVLTLVDSGLGTETVEVYKILSNIFQELSVLGFLNLTNSDNSSLMPMAVTYCEGLFKIATKSSSSIWNTLNPSAAWIGDDLVSSLALFTCSLLNVNQSTFSWETEVDIIDKVIFSMTPLASGKAQYFNAAGLFFSTLTDLVLSGANTTTDHILEDISILILPLLNILEEKLLENSWTLPIELYDIYSFLLNLVKTATTTNQGQTSATPKPTIEATQVLKELGKMLEAPCYSDALSSASELLELLFYSTGETPVLTGLAKQLSDLKEVLSNQSIVSPYRSLLSCLDNSTTVLANQSQGHPELVFQLIQSLFAQNYTFEDISLVPEVLGLKLSQLQNITSLMCNSTQFGPAMETCQLPCQYILQVLNMMKLGINSLTETRAANGIMSRAATNTTTNVASTSNSVLNMLLQNIAGELNSVNWIPSDLLPLDSLQNMSQYFSLYGINISLTVPVPQVGNLFGNLNQTKLDLIKTAGLSLENVDAMMNVTITNTTFQMIDWFQQLYACSKDPSLVPKPLQVFCNMSALQGYQMAIVLLQNVDLFNFVYRMFTPQKLQNSIDMAIIGLTTLVSTLNEKMKTLPPIEEVNSQIKQLQNILNLANVQMNQMQRRKRATQAAVPFSLSTLVNVLCVKNIPLLFAYINQLPPSLTSRAEIPQDRASSDLIEKFGIPTNTTTFCKNILVNMVNTTTGAFYWVFLKPMLYGQILYAPETAETRAIMQKVNATLAELDQLRTGAAELLSLMQSAAAFSSLITTITPLLDQVQSYLRNPIVQSLISALAKANATEMNSEIQNLRDYISILKDNQGILEQVTPMITLFVNLAECISYDRILPANSTDTLETKATLLRQQNKLFAGIIFDLPSSSKRRRRATTNRTALPTQVRYTIRMNIMQSQPTNAIRDVVWIPGPHETASKYMTYARAFIFLQDCIERAIIEMQTQRNLSDIAVQFQPMPYACYTKDNFLYSVSFALPIVLMVAWVLFVAAFVKRLVLEKDLRLHEYMKMMGVNTCSHFFAWFIESAIFLTITVIILVIIIKFGGILPRSDGGLIFLFLMDYSLSIIAMSYLISVFFHNTNIAALSGSLIYIISFFPFIVMTSRSGSLSFAGKTLLGLFSPTALSYATQYATLYEEQSLGLQWGNVYMSPIANDTCSFGWLCWLLLIDSGIYFIVGWYIRMVFPGRYGIGAPWYFPFQPSFWKECCGFSSTCSRKKPSGLMFTNIMAEGAMSSAKKGSEPAPSALSPVFETEPQGLVVGVSLHGLTKIYNSKTAVGNLNLNFYEGQITSLLGHNGAGKTTTISMLTGLFSATSGTINVYGEDIRNHLDHIRKSMGVCMQYDVLFSHLTTKEHLLLYGAIKAPQWDKRRLHAEVKRTLKDTGLYSHRYKAVRSLSGGMKRKLSICIALIGGSRVIILDEPTTGVDPCSRRAIWEIISKHKQEKTIILSTHHLDEAEVLSDRIAFLENGGLKCCGSPFFLKEKFGEGYHLTLTKKFEDKDTDQHCNTEALTTLIQSHIPDAYLKEDIGEELVYVLPPFNAGISAAYLSLLRTLDTGLDRLHIGCYGISDTTVEEVFLKLTEGLDVDENTWSRTKLVVPIGDTDDLMVHDEVSTRSYSFRDDQALTRTRKVGGVILLLKKMMAIFIKRFHNSRRNWKGLISQILLPVLFVIAAMGLGTLTSDAGEYPSLLLSPSLYGSIGQNVAFGNSNSSTDGLVNAMLSFPGIDNTCMNSRNCLTESQLGAWTSAGNESGSYCTCSCTKTTRECEIPTNANPPRQKTFSKQVIYNLSGYNMENYLLTTTNNFSQTRYGAWSYGLPLTSDLLLDSSPIPPNRTLTKVWYNSEGYHSLPAYLNSLNNFILRANLPYNQSSQYGIFVTSHPYPGALTAEQTQISNLVNILVALCILVGYSITTASFVIYTVKEHLNGSKRLQHISGISETCYWVTNFLYDMLLYMVPVALSISTIAGFKLPAFYENQNLGAVSLLLVMFGFATFTWMYLLAGTFKNLGMAFIVFVCINLFIGINTIISATVVDILAQDTSQNNTITQSLGNVSSVLQGIFKIFPQFCFGYGLIKLSQQQQIVDYYKAFGYSYPSNVFAMDVLGWMFVALMFQGVIFFVLRLLVNNTMYQNIRFFVNKSFGSGMQSVRNTVEEDVDVKAERDRVESGKADTDLLQLHGITKIYHQVKKSVVAVNNMSFGIRAGECFGLLGVNGAGKTTTFKMLTGDIAPSSGQIEIQDRLGNLVNVFDCHADWSAFGYCPQEDALDDLLTGEEHLYYYARIHGIPEKRIRLVVNDLLNKLQLTQYKSRITEAYSCGTKRKLSTALALIGGPSILLLDEPSSGMDPKTKRHLWKVISEEVRDKCAVVLTSHSMEECEALCTRLAIMVRGTFQCIGSMQHIKSRFGSGFTVKMHLRDSSVDVEALTQLLRGHFPNTFLKDHHFNMVEYHVPVSAGGVANIFDLLEANKAAFHIRHFSVSQTTLDEVFINFAQAQVTPENSNSNSQEVTRVLVT